MVFEIESENRKLTRVTNKVHRFQPDGERKMSKTKTTHDMPQVRKNNCQSVVVGWTFIEEDSKCAKVCKNSRELVKISDLKMMTCPRIKNWGFGIT